MAEPALVPILQGNLGALTEARDVLRTAGLTVELMRQAADAGG